MQSPVCSNNNLFVVLTYLYVACWCLRFSLAQECEDDATFVFAAWNSGGRTCAWLGYGATAPRKIEVLCPKIKSGQYVKDACPKTCNNCPVVPTVSPIPSTSPTTGPATCEDSTTFVFRAWNSGGRRCSWLSEGDTAARKIQVLCPVIKNGQYVKDACPKTCNNCPPEPTISPAPTSVSSAPSESPTVSNCVDDPTFLKNSKNCNQIRNQESTRLFLCQQSDVKASCPITCGLCCADSSTFVFGLNDQKDCDWIGATTDRKTKFCVYSMFKRNERVVYACSKTCDTCENEVTSHENIFSW